MNKKLTKIVGITLGLTMAVGVGTGVAFSVGNQTKPIYATENTYTLTIDESSFNTTSYAANNNEKHTTAVCTTDANVTMEVYWTSYQVYQNNGAMQWQKSKGYIYNSTNLGTINSVTVNSSAGTFTTYYGTTEQPSSGTAGTGKGFFKTLVGGATGTTSSVVVNFTITEGGDPELTPMTAPTISLSGNIVSWTNVEGNNGYSYAITGTQSKNGNLDANTTSLDVSTLSLAYGNYSITVVTKGNGTSTSDSVASNALAFVLSEPTVSGTFNKWTSSLVPGDYILTYGNVAMGNVVSNSSKIQNSSLSFTSGVNSITNPVAGAVWSLNSFEENSKTYWSIYNSEVEKYVKWNSSTNVSLVDTVETNAKWTLVTDGATKDFQVNGDTRRLRAYNSVWSSYASSNGGALTLYKKFVAATAIGLDNDEMTVGIGGHGDLTATLTPNNADSAITWSSSDEDIAKVNQSGVVTGVAAGSATITARVSELIYAECDVTVTAASIPATSVTLNTSSGSLVKGQSVTLTATVLPANTTDNLTWSSSDEDVATVSDGVVLAVGAGTATISATAGEQHAEYSLTVSALNALTAYPGASINAVGKLMAKNGKNAIIDDGTGAFWAFATANVTQDIGSIVRVQGNVINYNNKGGLEIENASISSAEGSITPATPEQLNQSEVLGYISAFKTSPANTVPHRRVSMRTGLIGGEGNFLTWTWPEGTALMETSISKATMEAGKVYDIDGYLINFYSTGDDTYLCVCVINAQEAEVAPESITLNRTQLNLNAGENSTLTATINPNGASGDITWISSQGSIATVTSSGVVTGVAAGSATITAFIDSNDNGVADVSEIKAQCAVVVSAPTRGLEKQSITADFTATMNVDNANYSIDGNIVHKAGGYHQDDSGDAGSQKYAQIKSESPMFSIAPASITLTARLGGGSNKDLGNPIKACFIDSAGNEIDSTIVTVTESVTTTATDYVVSLPYSADAYGVKIMHNKETSFNARYYSFNVSYNYAVSTATLLGNETGSGVESVKIKFSAKISVASWSSLGTVSDYGIMMFKRKASDSAYTGTNTPVKDAFRNNETLTVSHKGSGVISADGDYYIFSANVNINNPSNYGVVVCAAPFIVVDGTYYFLDEMEYSVNTLAQYHLANGGSSLSEDALNSLKGA